MRKWELLFDTLSCGALCACPEMTGVVESVNCPKESLPILIGGFNMFLIDTTVILLLLTVVLPQASNLTRSLRKGSKMITKSFWGNPPTRYYKLLRLVEQSIDQRPLSV